MEIIETTPTYFPGMQPKEFLQWERLQELKHEYVEGEIITVPGLSIKHNRIASNIHGRLWNFLQDKSCEVFSHDLRIAVKSKSSFFYPDVVVACDELEFDEELPKDTVKNPVVIFEILSFSTADFDLGRKLMLYMQIESLKQYIMVDSTKMYVRVMTRRDEEHTWKFDEYILPEDYFMIDSIHYQFTLADIYKGIKF